MSVHVFSWGCFIVLLAGCYLSFPANKLVSGEHCKIVQDASSGLVWLEDMRYLIINGFIIDYLLYLFYFAFAINVKDIPRAVPKSIVSNKHRRRAFELSVGVLYVESHGISLIFLCFSTNGTVINMSKLVKKQTHMLQNGDVIYFVYRKSEPEQSELLIN